MLIDPASINEILYGHCGCCEQYNAFLFGGVQEGVPPEVPHFPLYTCFGCGTTVSPNTLRQNDSEHS